MNELSGLLDRYKSIVVFDTETSGLDFSKEQIIELAAVKIQRNSKGKAEITAEIDEFVKLPEGKKLDLEIVNLTSITDEMLEKYGISYAEAAQMFFELINDGPTLLCAHNAQFDLMFSRTLLKGKKFTQTLEFLDTLTVYKDRRPFPHKLQHAITAYELEGKVQNSHRAIDDVKALFEVLVCMDLERPDLERYINLFGYNPKYGIDGCMIKGVKYAPQTYHKDFEFKKAKTKNRGTGIFKEVLKPVSVENTLYSYIKSYPETIKEKTEEKK